MRYWLLKTEPSAWSWDDQVKKGAAGEPWTGVRNFRARDNLKEMRKGDLAFFYHSVEEKRIVGIVAVKREAYRDPTDEAGKFLAVDVVAVEPLNWPVSLAEIKADPRFADMALARQPRLSVQPVSEAHWRMICEMGGVEPPASPAR